MIGAFLFPGVTCRDAVFRGNFFASWQWGGAGLRFSCHDAVFRDDFFASWQWFICVFGNMLMVSVLS